MKLLFAQCDIISYIFIHFYMPYIFYLLIADIFYPVLIKVILHLAICVKNVRNIFERVSKLI